MRITPSMRRHFDKHLRIVMRPDGVSQGKALVQQGLAPADDRLAIHKAYGRYRYWLHSWMDYYGMSRKALRKFAFSGGFQLPGEDFSVLEDQFDAEYEEACETYEAYEDVSLRVGDMVVANWNRGETSLVGEVVQILLIAGNQACVKAMNGTLMTYNLTNLRSIPKSF